MAQVILWNAAPLQISRTLGPYQLASWLRRHGYTVKVIDFCNAMSPAQVVEITLPHVDRHTIAIGASTTWWEVPVPDPEATAITVKEPHWVSQAREVIESCWPHLYWVLGGSTTLYWQQHASSRAWTVFKDYAEDDFLTWLDEMSDHAASRVPFDIKCANNCFMPDDHISPLEMLPVELGRGCKWKCKFCNSNGIGKKPGTYEKDVEVLYAEIMDHHDRWGTTKFVYIDDTVNDSVERCRALMDIADRVPFDLQWLGHLRADLIATHPETSEYLEASGLVSSFIGIESFEPKSASLVGKGWSGRHGKDWLAKQKERWQGKITWALGMLVGLPGQTEEQLHADCQWMIANNMHYWHWTPLYLEPGINQSEFSINSARYGYRFPNPRRPWEWSHDDWTFKKAREVSATLGALGQPHIKPAGFPLARYAALGYSFAEMSTKTTEDDHELWSRTQSFVDTYVDALMR